MGLITWFPAKDVCDVLGITNPSMAMRQLKTEQYQVVSRRNLSTTDVSFPARGMNCVNKSGIYKLIFMSRKPAALDFQDWVTDVVLPAIENDGGYVMGEEKVETDDGIDALALNVVSNMVTTDDRTLQAIAGPTSLEP